MLHPNDLRRRKLLRTSSAAKYRHNPLSHGIFFSAAVSQVLRSFLMLPSPGVFGYSIAVLLVLWLVLIFIGIVLRFTVIRTSSEPWNTVDYACNPRLSISTIASFPDLPQIVIDEPPDYEESRTSPCPSYEVTIATCPSLDLLTVVT
ncbi:hypothetical protein QR680_003849 [Steinernema hermaphroditum]|uniref:Uncharacterized protein n=1 Tax=Steinernema hermaphroditum TaxID=289476 RepID=A0AA39HP12_9BILA|nr:hypothetical protein QR680_003849 [Steinernema hermaphroditum]